MASANVVGSGTSDRSDRGRVIARHVADEKTNDAGRMGRRASRPPLMAERCLRTELISSILAPQRSSERLTPVRLPA